MSDSKWSPPRRITLTPPACECAGHAFVFIEQLCVADDAVERPVRSSWLMARDVAAFLGLVGEVGRALGLLQCFIGALVRFDFSCRSACACSLSACVWRFAFFLRDLPAFLCVSTNPPGDDGRDHDERGEDLDEAPARLPCAIASRKGFQGASLSWSQLVPG